MSQESKAAMRNKINLGLVDDHNETVPAHRAIPLALRNARQPMRPF